jgi:hypothetical protein
VRGKLENLIIFYSYLHLYFSVEKFKFEARLLLHHSDLSKTSCDTCPLPVSRDLILILVYTRGALSFRRNAVGLCFAVS